LAAVISDYLLCNGCHGNQVLSTESGAQDNIQNKILARHRYAAALRDLSDRPTAEILDGAFQSAAQLEQATFTSFLATRDARPTFEQAQCRGGVVDASLKVVHCGSAACQTHVPECARLGLPYLSTEGTQLDLWKPATNPPQQGLWVADRRWLVPPFTMPMGKLMFLHIPKTGGTAIEDAASTVGHTFGRFDRHYDGVPGAAVPGKICAPWRVEHLIFQSSLFAVRRCLSFTFVSCVHSVSVSLLLHPHPFPLPRPLPLSRPHSLSLSLSLFFSVSCFCLFFWRFLLSKSGSLG
jgi:hypothetical protein